MSEPTNEQIRLATSMLNFMDELEEQIYFARRKFPGREATTAALMEEVGELAKAMLQEDHNAIFLEAIQVATMAFRCMYDGDAGTDNYRATRHNLPPTGEATRPAPVNMTPLAEFTNG